MEMVKITRYYYKSYEKMQQLIAEHGLDNIVTTLGFERRGNVIGAPNSPYTMEIGEKLILRKDGKKPLTVDDFDDVVSGFIRDILC